MSLDKAAFVERFGGVYEHSAWIAESCWAAGRLADTAEELSDIMSAVVDASETERQLALIRAHPDLAGRLAVAGRLTAASTDEQSSAGLDQCTPEEFDVLQRLNQAYKEKFNFPFVMAVRNSNRHEIIAACKARLRNSYATEFDQAIAEIHKIARLRLEQLF
ncbi:MAG: 2-oxo-4-hydroxy-4-carboxy-5-ureidoimidazoline decarboxylase [bacterium]